MKKILNIDTIGTAALIVVAITILLCLTIFHNGTWVATFGAIR